MIERNVILKILFVLTTLTALSAGIIVLLVIMTAGEHSVEPCMTDSCLRQAAHIKSAMDENIDPCRDFYQYACGNWIKNTVPRTYDNSWDFFAEVEENVLDRIEYVLDQWETGNETELAEYEVKARDYYRSCMNDTAREETGVRQFMDLAQNIGLKFTILGIDGISGNISVNDKLFVNKTLWSALYNFEVSEPFRGGMESNFTLKIKPPSYTFSSDAYKNMTDETKNELVESINTAFTSLAQDSNSEVSENTRQRIYSRAASVADFEISLAEIRSDDWVEPLDTTLGQLSSNISQIDMVGTLQMVFQQFGIRVDSNFPVRVYDPDFFRALQPILETQDPETVSNFMLLSALTEVLPYLPGKFQEMSVDGNSPDNSRAKECLQMVAWDTDFRQSVAAALAKRFFSRQKYDLLPIMFESVREELLKVLEESDWLDEESREGAVTKMRNMHFTYGFPKTLLNESSVNDLLSEVSIGDQEFLMNNHQLERNSRAQDLRELAKRVDPHEFVYPPQMTNAAHVYTMNKISVLSGLLLPPFYWEPGDDAFTFGSAGALVGHEIGHGFDDTGVNWDEIGRYRSWMSNASSMAYEEKTQCYVTQYDNFRIHGRNSDGTKTLSENISDNLGLKIAFKGYERYQRENKQAPPPLPGIDLSWKQIFFLAWAQTNCRIPDEEEDIRTLETDVHSLGMFRVWGPVQNSHEFADAYRCQPGSPMNPVHKCQLW